MSSHSSQLRIHGKIPHVRTVTRSEAMQVRDGIISRLRVMSPFRGFTFSRSHAFKVMPDKMPYCSVYFLGEQLSPDGDANAGEVTFHSIVRIGFSVMLINNDPDDMEDKLDDYYQVIFRGLLRDSTLYNNPSARIQGYVQGMRQHVYGAVGFQEHETPYAELRAELQCDLGAIEYEPLVEDMLETIHVETVHPPGDTQNQHVFSFYDLDQGE